MVCPILLEHCPVCLSVTLVYCRQTVGWIKTPFGTKVGHGPGHIVLDRNPAPPPPKGHTPDFQSVCIVAERLPISATAKHSLHYFVIIWLLTINTSILNLMVA